MGGWRVGRTSLARREEKESPSIISAQLRKGQESFVVESSGVVVVVMSFTCWIATERDRVMDLGEDGVSSTKPSVLFLGLGME